MGGDNVKCCRPQSKKTMERFEDLINEFSKYRGKLTTDEVIALRFALKYGDEHPHVISVDVELPPCDEPYYDNGEVCDDLKCSKKVLVFADNDFHIATLNQNYNDGKKSGSPYWFDEEHSEDGGWLDGKVTHWMPLPDVLKKGD